MTKEEVLLNLAFREIGEPYSWGGQSPIEDEGFDCSGLVYYLYESIGLLPYKKDLNADGIVKNFQSKVDKTFTSSAKCGDLVYWENSNGRVTHIEMCIGNGLCLGASGGGSKTKTKKDAIRDNAFVRVRPIDARKGALVIKTSDLI